MPSASPLPQGPAVTDPTMSTPPLGQQLVGSIIGHRGMRGKVDGRRHVGNRPEDFAAAAAAGTRWVELDVRRTADGQLVVVHDPRVGSRAPSLLAAWFGGRAVRALKESDLESDPDDMPVRFDEVLAQLHAEGVGVDVHIKERGYEVQVVDAVRAEGMLGHAVFTSFEPDSVRAIEHLDPALRTGLLLWKPPMWRRLTSWLFPDAPVRQARAIGADMVAVMDAMAGPKLLEAAREDGVGVLVWTVNDARRAADLLRDPNVLGVITDRPDRMLHAAQAGPLAHVAR
jgi:glycerophosphoryl diester phosphodiesterase